MLKAQDGLILMVQVCQDVTEALPQLGGIRFKLHRLVKYLESLFEPSLTLQRGPKALEKLGLRILPNGPGEPFHGEIVLRGVKGQQAHQMKRARVIGIRCKRLLATNLGVEIFSGSQMTQTGFAKQRRTAVAVWSGPGFFSRGPTFATIHVGVFRFCPVRRAN